jgi:hypothetical protein
MNPRMLAFAALALAPLIPGACSPTGPGNPLAVAGHTFDLIAFYGSMDHSLPYVYEPEYFLGCWTSDEEYWAGAAEDSRLDAIQHFFPNASQWRLAITGATRCRTEDGVLSGWSDFAFETAGRYRQRGDTLDFLGEDGQNVVFFVALRDAGTRFQVPWVSWVVTPPSGHTIHMPAEFVRR